MKPFSILAAASFVVLAIAEDPDLAKARNPLIADLKFVAYGETSTDNERNPSGAILFAMGKAAIPALIEGIQFEKPSSMIQTVEALVRLNAREAIPALLAAYETETDPQVQSSLLRSRLPRMSGGAVA